MAEQDQIAALFTEAYIAEQHKDLPILANPENTAGGTYIVTGANVGIGFEVVKHLVNFGAAKVILAVRNVQAGESAKQEILKASAKTASNVMEVWPLDLASYASVNAFAKKAIDELDRIDALIENAGVAGDQWKIAEGQESFITVNVLGTLLLGALLFPKLSDTASRFKLSPRLVIVGSEVSFTAKATFDKVRDNPLAKLKDEKLQGMEGRYQLSKLIQLLGFRELSALLPASRTNVIINLVNPGLCKTSLVRGYNDTTRTQVQGVTEMFGRTAEMGSRTLLHAAFAGKESHGRYLSACEIRENEVSDWITNDEGQQAQKRVWADIAKELERAVPGSITSIL